MSLPLTKDQAEKIAELTSSVFQQGNSWVFKEYDLSTGSIRLTRGLSEKSAQLRLSQWRKEKLEELLRSNEDQPAYTLRVWHQNPSWGGEGIWRWASNKWFTNKAEALEVVEKKQSKTDKQYEIYEIKTKELPGHFKVYR